MTIPLNHAKLGFILPAFSNPATAAVIGIGLIAAGLYRMLPDDDENETLDAVPSEGPKIAIPTVEARLPAVEQREVQQGCELSSDAQEADIVALETAKAPTPDADQREVIRKAMSELGKRSAAARAKKKLERGKGGN